MAKVKKYFEDWTMFEKSWLVLSSVIMISLSLVWGDSILAILSGIAGVVSVVLCAKGKIENYAFGLFQAITYGYICLQASVYGEVMYNVVMVPMIIFGFFSWKKNMSESGEEVKARNLTAKGWVILGVGSVAAIYLYSLILGSLGGEFTLIDSTSTTLSFIATILMLARFSEQWIVWIVVNIASVILWCMAFAKGDPSAITMICMWSAYLLNAIYGYYNWRKLAKANA